MFLHSKEYGINFLAGLDNLISSPVSPIIAQLISLSSNVLNIDNFYSSCNYLKENNFVFEKHLLEGDSHTISPKAINLLQKFIKKNL